MSDGIWTDGIADDAVGQFGAIVDNHMAMLFADFDKFARLRFLDSTQMTSLIRECTDDRDDAYSEWVFESKDRRER